MNDSLLFIATEGKKIWKVLASDFVFFLITTSIKITASINIIITISYCVPSSLKVTCPPSDS